jgi:hypothetical protein
MDEKNAIFVEVKRNLEPKYVTRRSRKRMVCIISEILNKLPKDQNSLKRSLKQYKNKFSMPSTLTPYFTQKWCVSVINDVKDALEIIENDIDIRDVDNRMRMLRLRGKQTFVDENDDKLTEQQLKTLSSIKCAHFLLNDTLYIDEEGCYNVEFLEKHFDIKKIQGIVKECC